MPKADADTQEATTSGQAEATDTTTNDQVDDRNLGEDWDEPDSSFENADDDSDLETESNDDSAATDESDAEDSEDVEEVDESTEETETTEDSEDTEDSDSEDSSESTKDDEAEDKPLTNDEAAKLRIEQRKAREEADRLRQQREDESIERFLEEAGDDELERQRRENAVKEFRIQEREINLNRQSLQVGIERAVASIDLFRTGTDLQKAALADALDDFEALHIQKDKQGRPVAVNGDVVAFLQRKAESIKKLAGEGVKRQEKQKSKQKTRTMVTPRRAPVKAKADPMLEGFDEEAGRP